MSITTRFNMKNLFSLIIFCLLATFAQAQTAAVTPSSVEIIAASATTRAFYDLDDVYFRYKGAGVEIFEASSGTRLFNGDTSEVSVTGASHWAAKAFKLVNWYQDCTNTAGYRFFLPKRSTNIIYKGSDTSVKLVHNVTKKLMLATAIDSVKISGVTGASNILTYLRGQFYLESMRDALGLANTATIAADTSAGSSPTIAVTGNGVAGLITLTTGTSAKATGNIFAVTLPVTYPTGTFVTLTAGNTTAGVQIARVFVEGATNKFTVKCSGTALSDATQYKWHYRVTGY